MKTCKNYKKVELNPQYLNELARELLKFHNKVGTKYFSGADSLKTFSQKFSFFKRKTKELTDSCHYNYLGVHAETNSIFGFCCFRIENGVCYNPFIFKSEDFKLSSSTFKGSLDVFGDMKKMGFDEIHTIIDRKDPERYLKFLQRYYNITVKHGDPIKVIFHI